MPPGRRLGKSCTLPCRAVRAKAENVGKGVKSGKVSEIEVMQHNVPPEWRLSKAATSLVSPVALNAPSKCLLESQDSSLSSVDMMYPGRLG